MSETVDVIPIEDEERWKAEHRSGGLPSQSWDYARALSASGISPELAVVRSKGARMLLPFFERTWMGSIDVATLIGFSGASIIPQSRAPLELWREFAQSKGWVAGYIQVADAPVGANLPETELVVSNEVLLLDLGATDIAISASSSIRAKVRQTSSAAVKLVEDRESVAERFKQIYPQTMERVKARSIYRFSPETLERLVQSPASLAVGAQLNGSIEAICVFLVAPPRAEWHSNGNTERGRELTAWLVWKAAQRLREMGVTSLNLGGGARPGDGLFAFKKRFGATSRPLLALRQIYDTDKFRSLCAMHPERLSAESFPPYRTR